VWCNNITYGVKQSSVLGILVFLTYINDLTPCDIILTMMIADDTSVFRQGNNMHGKEIAMNSDILA